MRKFAAQLGWAAGTGGFAIDAAVNERLGFLRKTYSLLTAQILIAGTIAALIINTPALLDFALNLGNPIIYLIAVFALALGTRKMLEGTRPMGVQYAAAALWCTFLGALVTPFCAMAAAKTGSYEVVGQAFVLTSCVFIGITAYVLTTKKDFSFIGAGLWMASFAAMGIGLLLYFMGGSGGIWYSIMWIALMCGWILYDTSKVLHKYPVNAAVAASVMLLVDFVYLFIYILMLLTRSRD